MQLDKFEEDGVTYYQLLCSCPVCLSRGVNTPQTLLMHGDGNCHGDIYVGDNACCKCIKCGHLSQLSNCEFRFPCCHSDSPDALVFFDRASEGGFSSGIGIAGQMADVAGIQWLQRFLENLQRDKVWRSLETQDCSKRQEE